MRHLFEDDISAVKDFNDYAITSSGRVFSYKQGYWRELKPQKDTDGYLQVVLFRDNKRNPKFVHRLVADAFIFKPHGSTEVNHKDGNKLNNDASNLEWCTRRDNIIHAHKNGLINTQTPLKATNKTTGEVLYFRGQHEAANYLGVNQGNISHALKRPEGSAYGYIFEYIDKEASYI